MGYERPPGTRLLFLHNHFQTNSLTRRRRSLDDDEVDRPARSVVVENADRQSSRSPGKRVQIGPPFVKQRAVGLIIMAMDNVEIAKAVGISLGIALPQQRLLPLAVQSNIGVDARM